MRSPGTGSVENTYDSYGYYWAADKSAGRGVFTEASDFSGQGQVNKSSFLFLHFSMEHVKAESMLSVKFPRAHAETQ